MKPVTKTIKRRNAKGVMVNYGNLVVGIRNGTKCLGCKEGLLLLGIRLVKEKVPAQFETEKTLVVTTGSRTKITIYGLREEDLPRLGSTISSYGFLVKLVKSLMTLTAWEDGEVVFTANGATKTIDTLLNQATRKKKPLSWWQRFLAKFR